MFMIDELMLKILLSIFVGEFMVHLCVVDLDSHHLVDVLVDLF